MYVFQIKLKRGKDLPLCVSVEWLLSGEKHHLAPLGLDDLDCDLKSLTVDSSAH